jgi:hypothetical protein
MGRPIFFYFFFCPTFNALKNTKCTHILKNLTPLDSINLELFFEDFCRIFHFFNLNLNYLNLAGRNRSVPLPVRTGKTGDRGFPTGSHWYLKPCPRRCAWTCGCMSASACGTTTYGGGWRGARTMSRAFAFRLCFLLCLALFDHVFLQMFELKCTKIFIPNL